MNSTLGLWPVLGLIWFESLYLFSSIVSSRVLLLTVNRYHTVFAIGCASFVITPPLNAFRWPLSKSFHAFTASVRYFAQPFNGSSYPLEQLSIRRTLKLKFDFFTYNLLFIAQLICYQSIRAELEIFLNKLIENGE